jgi:PAS domain S-box-containing protein
MDHENGSVDLETFLAGTADGACAIGLDGVIVSWNAAAQKILGYEPHETIGKTCREIFDGRDAAGNLSCSEFCTVRNHARMGEPVRHFQFKTKRRSGESVWLDVSVVFLSWGFPNIPVKRIHMFRDVTASHEIEGMLRESLAAAPPAPKQSLPAHLTRREMEIIRCMQEGIDTAAIAERLYISRATVRNHIQNIFTKLDVHNRLEAVAVINRCGLQL